MSPQTIESLASMFATCHQVYVETNPHHVNYETVTGYLTRDPYAAEDFHGVPDNGRTVYLVQVYQHTPTRSVRALGHDIDVVVAAVFGALV